MRYSDMRMGYGSRIRIPALPHKVMFLHVGWGCEKNQQSKRDYAKQPEIPNRATQGISCNACTATAAALDISCEDVIRAPRQRGRKEKERISAVSVPQNKESVHFVMLQNEEL